MTDDLVKRLREVGNKNGLMYADYDTTIEAADRIEAQDKRNKELESALREMLEIVATHRVYVGNSPAGELACEWTMDAIKEIHAKMEEVLARAALGEKKDDR